MKQILFLLIVFITFSCQKQQEEKNNIKETIVKLTPPPPKIIDKKTLIGFACYYGGIKSEAVMNVSEILKTKNYTTLKAKLYCINPAEKYLATVACEKLETKKLIKLTEKDVAQIKTNKSSEEKVTLCDGCTNEEELMLKQMFTSEDNFLKNLLKNG